jgi:hypothetical protein
VTRCLEGCGAGLPASSLAGEFHVPAGNVFALSLSIHHLRRSGLCETFASHAFGASLVFAAKLSALSRTDGGSVG